MNNGMEIMGEDLRLVVFDCDGTIVDSQNALVETMHATFEEHNLTPPEREKILQGVGLELSVGIERLLSGEGIDKLTSLCSTYKEIAVKYREENNNIDPLYLNAEKTIRALYDANWLLGIATGKSRAGLDHVLNRYDMGDLFVTLQTSDCAPGKPDPGMLHNAMRDTGVDPGSVFMVGDTTYDMAMAVNAGTGAIGVSWGYHKVDELLDAGAEMIVNSYEDLFFLLEEGKKNNSY